MWNLLRLGGFDAALPGGRAGRQLGRWPSAPFIDRFSAQLSRQFNAAGALVDAWSRLADAATLAALSGRVDFTLFFRTSRVPRGRCRAQELFAGGVSAE